MSELHPEICSPLERSLPRPSTAAITPLFLIVIVVPTIVYYMGFTSSLALGASLAAALLIARFIDPLLCLEVARSRAAGAGYSPLVVAATCCALVSAHAAIAWLYEPFDFGHALASLVPLALIVVGGSALGNALLDADEEHIERAVGACFVLFCIIAVIGVSGISPPTAMTSPKPLFPFTEPSHFALIFTPFYLYCCVRSRGLKRFVVLGIGLAIAAALQNLTLVTACLLASVICIRALTLVALLLLAAIGVMQLESLDLSYYAGRLDFSDDMQNLSALVYVQGWQLVGESLTRSGGWGLGFQQLGLHGTTVPAAAAIFDITQAEGNLRDGGFTFSKIVCEFGVLGLLAVAGYAMYAARALLKLRAAARTGQPGARLTGDLDAGRTFACCVVVAYLLELFVRGTGYFSGTALLLVAAVRLMRPHRPWT